MNHRTFEPFLDVSSLYIHIPFCVKKCSYCDFYSVQYEESLTREYTDALCVELHLKNSLAGRLTTVYIGGGTPSLLSNDCFTRIFSCLRDNFQVTQDAEITVEANPGTLDQPKVDLLLSLGVNRMSIGVQSFHNTELRYLGRIHTAAEAVSALNILRTSGMVNYSLDLMYGIPGQSTDSWLRTITVAAEYHPKHVSAYELTPEAGTPIFNKVEKPGEDVILDMYDLAINSLAARGYEHYEISNFAQRGFHCLHNLNYWDRGGYIGAGAGAHSFMNETRSNNIRDVERYIDRLNNNLLPESESVKISSEERLREFLLLGLRKTEGIRITAAYDLGLDIVSAAGDLFAEGYLEIRDGFLRCTRKGIVMSNAVLVRLFRCLGT